MAVVMLAALVLDLSADGSLHLASRLGVVAPPDSGWGAAWEAQARAPAFYPLDALAALLRALAPVAGGAFAIALVSLTLHAGATLLAERPGLSLRRALGAHLPHLAALAGRAAGRPVLAGLALGTVGGLGLVSAFAAGWPVLLTRPSPLLPGPGPALAALAACALAFALVAVPILALVERGVRGVGDLHGDHVTAGGPWARAPGLLAALQLSAALVVTYGSALVLRGAGVLDRPADRPMPSATIVPLTWTGDTAAAPRARAAAYRQLLAALARGGAAETAITSPDAWLGLGKELAVVSLCGDCFVGSAFVPMSSASLRAAAAAPGSLARLGLALVRGRDFAEADGYDAPRVVVLTDAAASRLFPGADALGRVVRTSLADGSDYRVVGIVRGPAPGGLGSGGGVLPMIWFSVLQHPPAVAELAAPAPDEPTLRRLAAARAGGGPVADLGPAHTLAARRAAYAAPLTWFGGMSGVIALLGGGLALVAFASLMMQSVRRHRRAIAIRRALGAGRRHIAWWLGRRALGVIAAGTVLGMTAARWLGDALGGALGRSVEGDLWLLVRLMAAFAAVGLAATLVPAWRATRVEPAAVWADRTA